MPAPIPRSNVEEVIAKGPIGISACLTAAKGVFGERLISYFLDLVPEREGELWTRFTTFRDGPDGGDFIAFVESVIVANRDRMFYPKDCTLDAFTQGLLVSEIQKVARITDPKKSDDILQIFYADGPHYNAARQVSCRGCPQSQCERNLKFNSRR